MIRYINSLPHSDITTREQLVTLIVDETMGWLCTNRAATIFDVPDTELADIIDENIDKLAYDYDGGDANGEDVNRDPFKMFSPEGRQLVFDELKRRLAWAALNR